MPRETWRISRALAIALALPCCLSAGQDVHDHPAPEHLGAVTFPTSCREESQSEFTRGIALLHSFAYAASQSSFRAVLAKDPDCAIARWGVAMTYFHQIWDPPLRPESLARGREDLRQAQQGAESSARERGFIRALAVFYEQDPSLPYLGRASKYADAMDAVATANPNDPEAQAFHALALLAAASQFDTTHANQKRAADILEPLFARYPQHPGIAHYLIHACDNPEMARRGLPAARAYAAIAPSAPHALHMPSHIFTRLGMWDESISSNLAAQAAARAQGDTGEELHAMDYLVYAYLQEGRDADAAGVIGQLQTMNVTGGSDFKGSYASTAMPVRYAVERGRWTDAAAIVPPPATAPPHVTAVAVWARALGMARSGHSGEAQGEVEKLRQLAHQLHTSGGEYAEYWARQVEVQGLEASAWIAQAEGKHDEARTLLEKAASQEDAMEKLPVTPGPVIPAREQLGELLLEQGQPALARKAFQTALTNAPGRRGALAGEAKAS